ncbi:pyrroline-5-carboxylate reductase [Paralimibaculum aggregatum]|uniref:Pyrroline-5-carboxylate reductase n=1 Tax=Paralimibaculum aggregatum TaxID=3036245 RepID=A0ABQ6LJY4_9RHOB|nr:pyrroline-5-carboxylate reductase [Limibaculum sp. NKW23]GMG82535.1 pyrroline-5-carboxylate reductase [Limibaculum sp. NKW23]
MGGNEADISAVGRVLLLGCGRMGGAMLAGWLAGGLRPGQVQVIEPHPSDWLGARAAEGLALNPGALEQPDVAVLAVKPQMMAEAAPGLAAFGGGGTLMLSVAAGTPIARFEAMFGPGTPIIRAMPNTPAAIGRGISAYTGNAAATETHHATADILLRAVGKAVRLEGEHQMDAVTGLSGSGPAYVFHLIEAMAAAGEAQGLAPDLAMTLARETVCGAGALAGQDPAPAAVLRENVTSPGGTTAAGLAVLMEELPDLMRRTVAAAADRGRELARD